MTHSNQYGFVAKITKILMIVASALVVGGMWQMASAQTEPVRLDFGNGINSSNGRMSSCDSTPGAGGSTVNFSATLTNYGTAKAANIEVNVLQQTDVDPLPGGFPSVSPGGSYAPSSPYSPFSAPTTWNIASIVAGGGATISGSLFVPTGKTYRITTTVVSASPGIGSGVNQSVSCDGTGGGGPGGGGSLDYGIICGPKLQAVNSGSIASYLIEIDSAEAFFGAQLIRVTVPNAPSGITVDPIAPFGSPGFAAAVVHVAPAVAPGNYPLTFVASQSGGQTHQDTCNLHVNLSAFDNNPKTLNFSAVRNSAPVPSAQNVTLTNTGDVALNPISIGKTPGATWLTVTPANQTSLPLVGQVQVSVQPNTTSLAAGTYNATVTFSHPRAGLKTTTIQYIVTDPPPPDFNLSCRPRSGGVPIDPGQSAVYDITVNGVGGFSGTVVVSLENSPHPTITANNASVAVPPGTGSITVQTTLATPPNSYNLTLAGTGGGLTRRCSVPLVVKDITPPTGDFGLDCGPALQQVIIPGMVSYLVSVTQVGGNGSGVVVDLSATSDPAGPNAPQVSVVPPQIIAPGIVSVIVDTSLTTAKGHYTIIIVGRSGAIEHTCKVELDVLGPPACPPVCPYATPSYSTPGSYSTPTYPTPVARPDLSLSDKDIISVNGTPNPGASAGNGLSDIPLTSGFKSGDIVRFKINIVNSGGAPATNVRVEDRFLNLKLASPSNIVFTGCDGSSTETAVGIDFIINDPILVDAICGIAFNTVIQAPPGAVDGVYRFQNVGIITADGVSKTVRTPLLLFTVGKTPIKEEVAP